MGTAIAVKGLTKVFNGLVAVDHIYFKVKKGTIFGFLGPNGAGKTTTLRMLSTVLKPTVGTAEVGGYDVVRDDLKVRKIIGVLPEDVGVYDRLTPVETLIFQGKLYNLSSEKLKERINELLEVMGLREQRNMKVGKFSKGMKQKVALMRALLHDPEILFLDEPTSGLDVMSAREIRDIIVKNASQGKTVVISTHNMWEVEKICKYVAIIHKGKILIEGKKEEIEKVTKQKDFEEVFVKLVKEETNFGNFSY